MPIGTEFFGNKIYFFLKNWFQRGSLRCQDYQDFIDNYEFIDIDEDKVINYKNIIESFLKENSIDYEGLKKDKTKLKELITKLKENYRVSFRKIEKEIGLNRESIRKIYYK